MKIPQVLSLLGVAMSSSAIGATNVIARVVALLVVAAMRAIESRVRSVTSPEEESDY